MTTNTISLSQAELDTIIATRQEVEGTVSYTATFAIAEKHSEPSKKAVCTDIIKSLKDSGKDAGRGVCMKLFQASFPSMSDAHAQTMFYAIKKELAAKVKPEVQTETADESKQEEEQQAA